MEKDKEKIKKDLWVGIIFGGLLVLVVIMAIVNAYFKTQNNNICDANASEITNLSHHIERGYINFNPVWNLNKYSNECCSGYYGCFYIRG